MPRLLTICLITIGLSSIADAQELTGTLKRVADTGEFRIGYVPDAPPMSFLDTNGKPAGYSIMANPPATRSRYAGLSQTPSKLQQVVKNSK